MAEAEAAGRERVWHPLDAPPPEEGRSIGVVVGERRVLVCRVGDEYFALDDRCPHAQVRLSGGRLLGYELECPVHGGRVDVRDGAPAGPPIRRAVPVHRVREREGRLEVALPEQG